MDDIVHWFIIGCIAGPLLFALYSWKSGNSEGVGAALQMAFYMSVLMLCALGLNFFSERTAAKAKACIEDGGKPVFTIQNTYSDCAYPKSKSK